MRPTGCATKRSPSRPPSKTVRVAAKKSAGDVAIGSPLIGQRVKGIVPIIGNARGPDFRAYKVEVASAARPTSGRRSAPSTANRSATASSKPGTPRASTALYTLRLTVMRNDGSAQTSDTQVVVDSKPPEVKIIHPKTTRSLRRLRHGRRRNGQHHGRGAGQWEMDRVEFYLDGAQDRREHRGALQRALDHRDGQRRSPRPTRSPSRPSTGPATRRRAIRRSRSASSTKRRQVRSPSLDLWPWRTEPTSRCR